MKKAIIFIFYFVCTFCHAQEVAISPNDLISTKWELVDNGDYPEKVKKTIEFTRTEIKNVRILSGKTKSFKKNYYISNVIPQEYSTTLVGKNVPNGKYLVVLNPKLENMIVYKIESFSTDSLILSILNGEHLWGALMVQKYARVK